MALPIFLSIDGSDEQSDNAVETHLGMLRAIGYYRLGCFLQAERAAQSLLQKFPDGSLARLYLASSQYHQGKWDEAAKNATIIFASSDSDVLRRAAQMLLGCLAARENRYSTALYHFYELAHEVPEWDEALYNVALCCFNIGEYETSAHLLECYLDLHPDESVIVDKLAQVASVQAQVELSQHLFRRGTWRMSLLAPLRQRLSSSQPSLAEGEKSPLLKKILTLSRHDPQALFSLFWLSREMGEDSSARAPISSQMLAHWPHHPLTHLCRCLWLTEQGMEEVSDYRESYQFLRTRTNLFSQALASYLEGRCWLKKGEFSAARQSLRQAVLWLPDFHEAHYLLGCCSALQGDWQSAVSAWQQCQNC